jgi:hypothetical protein
MLRRARREGWTGQRLHFEVQRLYPSRRRGAGGPPRRDSAACGAYVTLRELVDGPAARPNAAVAARRHR